MRQPLLHAIAVFLAALAVLSLFSGFAAAQSGVGGTIVVEDGETVSEVNTVSGSVVIHGTVTGDVSGAAGNVLITGTVGGNVNVATGNLQITGQVGGDVSAGAGSVHLEDGATVGGNFDVGAGDVRIDGTIDGDVRIGAETIRLGETALIAGSLTYDGSLEGNRDAVAGDVTRDRTIGATSVSELQPLVSWVVAVYAFVANLLLGAVLLALFPRLSTDIADRVASNPLRTGLVGLGMIVLVALFLLALVLTIIGIPIALVGLLLFVLTVWVGLVYGRFALGMWIIAVVRRRQSNGRYRPWIGLLVGLLLGGILAAIPVIGGLINFLIILLGLGALTLGLYTRPTGSGSTVTEP